MNYATIKINGAAAYVVCRSPIPAGIIGAQVTFSFDDLWDNRHKTVVFRTPHITKDVILAHETSVTIPQEVVAKPCPCLQVGVYGTDDKSVLPTLWANLGRVYDATDPSGDESTNPDLPVWAQILELVGDGTGLSEKAAALLITILQAAQYKTDQTENIEAMAADFCVRGKSANTVVAYLQTIPGVRYTYAIDGSFVHVDVE